MIISIIIGIIVVCVVIYYIGGVLKNVLEAISFITKFIICGAMAWLLFKLLPFELEWWGYLLAFFIGGYTIFGLLFGVLSSFRLVAYSVNYFICSIIVLIVVQLFIKKQIDFVHYILILFLFPRIMWISDRFSTLSEYSHTEHDFFSGISTNVFLVEAIDWWDNSSNSWGKIPLQVIISSIFYIFGSVIILSIHTFDPTRSIVLYIILSTVINMLFDLYVFRKIDKLIDHVVSTR